MNMARIYLLIVFLLTFPIEVFTQEINLDDYKRAVSFMYDNYNNKTAFNLFTSVNWFNDQEGLWYINHSKDGKSYVKVEFDKLRPELLFNQELLAQRLSDHFGEKIESTRLPLTNIKRSVTDKSKITFSSKNKQFNLNLDSYELTIKNIENEEEDPLQSKSPDGKWLAYTKDYNLYIQSIESGEEFQLSDKGSKDYQFASWYGWFDKMEGENGERPKRFYVNWSPDSKWISTSVVDTRNAEKMYLLDWSIDSLFKPKLLSYYRGSPGDTTMVKIKPVFYNIDSKSEVKTELPTGTHINSLGVEWFGESGQLITRYAERGYQKEIVNLVDLNRGSIRNLITETSKTNIDNFWHSILEEHETIIFLSERSGWRQLYACDIASGEIRPLTRGNYHINSVVHTDEKAGDNEVAIYFLASGRDVNMNPYHQQLYMTDLNGNIKNLTTEKKHHMVSFGSNNDYFVDNYSTISKPMRTVLRDGNTGAILLELTRANVADMTDLGWRPPQVFDLIAKDGKTTIHGALWKPTNFDPSKSYPIIDATYTGPHTQRFPKSFNRGFDNQSLAELGFIVMQVDGLGTSGRSKEFHDYSYKNMGSNLEDHVLAIKELAKRHSWIDSKRVGIFGHSAGGYDTGRALLAFPDFYKVGVASSADHDFRMEKAWWPEMYQGWPVDSTYHEVSNITNASNLKGKLLLAHGGIDDNVNPSATFKLAEALIKADKQFDLVIFPSQRHGYTGDHRKYFIKRRWNYFVEHLRGSKPIWDFNWTIDE